MASQRQPQQPDWAVQGLTILESYLRDLLKDLQARVSVDRKSRAVAVDVDRSRVLDAAKVLRAAGFDHVKSLTGVDHGEKGHIDLVIHLGSYEKGLKRFMVILRTPLDRKDPRVPTFTEIWPSSEFQEREAWEMFGIVFEGHPDLRRLLLPEDFEGAWPGRRDFEIVSRRPGEVEEPWK